MSLTFEILSVEGEVINTIVADLDFVAAHYPGAYRALPDAPLPVIEASSRNSLTKLEYMDRFTDDELAGIYSAAKNSIQVEIWLERFKLATEVDLTDPRTVSGVQALEAAGLIGQGRSVEILMGSVSTEAVVEITAP